MRRLVKGGLLAVVLVGAAVLGFLRSDEKPEYGDPLELGSVELPLADLPDPPPEPGEARDAALRSIFAHAGREPERLRASCGRFRALGEPEWAKKAARALLIFEPDDEPANLLVGNRPLREIFDALPAGSDLDIYPDEACRVLLRAREKGERWGSGERWIELAAVLDRALPHLERLRTDRAYREEWVVRTNVRMDSVFRDFDYEVASRPPYLVFAEWRKGRRGGDSAQQRARRDADLLHATYEEFHRLFGERFGLVRCEELPRPEYRVLKAFRMEREPRLLERILLEPGASRDGRSRYQSKDRWIFLYPPRPDEILMYEDMAALDAVKVAFEGVMQLLHLHRKATIERLTGEEALWTDDRTIGNLDWFNVGLASLISSHLVTGSGKIEFMQPNLDRLTEWKEHRNDREKEWSLEVMMGSSERQAVYEGVREILEHRGSSRRKDALASLFHAQAWSFCHFLWFGGEGKYRDRFLDYLGREFRGRSSPKEFKKAMGPVVADGWEALEREWLAHVEELWKRHGIR